MNKYSLGIDIAKDDFKCCISTIDSSQKVTVKASRTFPNTPSGFRELNAWTEKNHKQKEVPLVVVMEATGVYYEQLALFLSEAAYKISVVLPNKAKKYLQSLGLKSKNDNIDARGLSAMGAQQCLDLWQPMSGYFYKLRALTRFHQNLREQQTMLSNQLHALEHGMYIDKQLIKSVKSLIATIEKQIAAFCERIEKHLRGDKEVMNKVDKILKVKGLGLLSVATILAETNGFALFENRGQLVSYAGYDVVENQSGKRSGRTRISKKGNSRIRRMLHMPALNVVRYEPVFKSFHLRLMERYDKKKEKMKAYVAVQKKLLLLIYTLWKKDEAFISDYGKAKVQQTADHVAQIHTGEEELASSSLRGPKAATRKKSSARSGATQGRHTVELSQSASSLQPQI